MKTISFRGQTLTMSEDDAFELLNRLRDTFGWSGVEFCRGDAEEFVKVLSDSEWDEVRYSWEWTKGLPSSLTTWGWDVVREAVASTGLIGSKKKETE